MRFTSAVTAAALFGAVAIAHPGHDMRQEVAERAEFLKNAKRQDLSHCSAKLKARGLEDKAIKRRSEKLASLRKERGISTETPYLKVRDSASVLATNHSSSAGYTGWTDPMEIFASNSSCILGPEVTQGPYYASGEYIRQNLIEDQEGVPLFLETQVLDVSTCEPIVNAYIDIWNCNSTGVYSGVIANGNGNSADTANLQEKFLRGIQPTSEDGIATFETLVPGHYTSRANHIHVLVHLDGTVAPNATYIGGTYAHVGQVFFDQDLLTQVEATYPYTTNTQDLTTNAEDSIFTQEAATIDPVVEYTLLGDSIEDGLLAWISFGVDTSTNTTFTPAASCYAEGCVENESSGGGGGGGAPGGGFGGGAPGNATSA